MKKFLIWALVIVGVTIGIVGAGVQFAASRLVDRGLDEVKLQLPENVAFDYADSDVSLLSRKASLKQVNLTLEDENLNVKVGEWTVDELQPSGSQDVPLIVNGVQLQDVELTPLDTGETVYIDEVVLRDVGDMLVDQMTNNGGEEFRIPASLDVELVGIQVTAEMLAAQEIDVDYEALGYQLPMEADVSLKYTFSDSDRDFQLDRMRIAAGDMFTFDASTHISGIDTEMINMLRTETASDPFMILDLVSQLRLHDFNIMYTDDSFMDRALTQMAEEEGSSLQALKADLIATIDEMAAAETSPETAEATTALRDFINDPGELTIGINPDAPLTAEQVMVAMDVDIFTGAINAEALAELLNITVSSR